MLEQSHIYQEIHQQPRVLADLLDGERANVERLVADLRQRHITHCVIAARGTSDNAGRYAQYLFGAVNGLTVGLATPSLHTIYGRPPRYDDALVIGISQSGKSPDIVSVIAEARRQGAVTLAISNSPPLRPGAGGRSYHPPARRAGEGGGGDQNLHRRAGGDRAAQRGRGGQPGDAAHAGPRPRADRADAVARAGIARQAERYRYMRVCVVIGRGYNYATAFETALKIKAELHRGGAVQQCRLHARPSRADRGCVPRPSSSRRRGSCCRKSVSSSAR